MAQLRQFRALLYKDFLVLGRRWYELPSLALVSMTIGVGVSYVVSGPRALVTGYSGTAAAIVAGQLVVYFIVAVSAGFLAILREAEKGTLDALRSYPLNPETLFMSKLVYTFILISLLAFTYTASTAFFSGNPELLSLHYAAATLAVGLYFAAASALTSFMVVYVEARSLLAAVVLTGLVVPYLGSAVDALVSSLTSPSIGVLVENLTAGLAFAVLATLLSRPLSEI